jgi:hypothetical protein
MKRASILAVLCLCLRTHARAHRLDEYLQSTLLTLARDHVEAEMTLTPGVAVFAVVVAGIDTNRDGILSPSEERAYARRVLGDLSLYVDGRRTALRLLSVKFPEMDAMKEGRGEIRIEFAGDLPGDGSHRHLTLENRHQPAISAWQVNCLVPRDPAIQVTSQRRNYTQSHYELEYTQPGGPTDASRLAGWPGGPAWMALLALGLAARFLVLWRPRRLTA